MSSCQRCGLPGSSPRAFLLTCRGCRKAWHHRCHMPPIEDNDLIQLIRATNRGDTENDLGSWMCRRCKKRASETPSTMSSREPTASSATSRDSLATTDVRVKQELKTTVDGRLASDQERHKSDRQSPDALAAPVKPTVQVSAKRTKSSTENQSLVQPQPGPVQPGDMDVQMADATSTKFNRPEKEKPPQRPSFPTHSFQAKAARKFSSTVPTKSDERDVQMIVDSPTFSESTSRAASRVLQPPSSISPELIAAVPPNVRANASSPSEWGREVGSTAGAASQVDQVAAEEIDDDPEDLYGPPVERRIIRILPSLAEELREQQRRVAAEKEKRRAPLAPDWILARHAKDPLWKEVTTEGRKRQKAVARKLGDNGLNVNELMDCFTVQNWVREHKD